MSVSSMARFAKGCSVRKTQLFLLIDDATSMGVGPHRSRKEEALIETSRRLHSEDDTCHLYLNIFIKSKIPNIIIAFISWQSLENIQKG
jgi:hypothetical protein